MKLHNDQYTFCLELLDADGKRGLLIGPFETFDRANHYACKMARPAWMRSFSILTMDPPDGEIA